MDDTPEVVDEDRAGRRHRVLDIFGIELEVSNARLAEILTMDAGEALATDVRRLVTSDDVTHAREEAAEAAPDVLLSPTLPRDDEEARQRHVFRTRVHEVGAALGFDVGADGVWRSPTGLAILTRCVERPVSFAAAAHYVTELAARHARIAGDDSTALFVVGGQQTADVFKVSVRRQRLHDVMRTISLDNLCEIGDLHRTGHLTHQQALVLLVPLANIDVGEVISILHSASADGSGPSR